MTTKPSALIADASAERFTRRGHDPVVVARDNVRMEALAGRLHQETGVKVNIL